MKQKEYTRTFEFGRIDATGTGQHRNLVTLKVALKVKESNQIVFTASGNVWNGRHTDIIQGGQCIDSVWDEYRGQLINRKKYADIMRLWELWHLNDRHAGCIHQRIARWGNSTVRIAHLKLNYDRAGSAQSAIEKRVMDAIKTAGTATITEDERELLNRPYFLTVPAERVQDYPLYDVDREEEALTGHTRPEEHPRGVLGKACNVCGYKYGTAWKYQPIDRNDLAEIIRLLEIDPLEGKHIMEANEAYTEGGDQA